MLPIGDSNPTRTTPFVNYALLVTNVVAFLWEYYWILMGGESWVVPGYGLVATRLLGDPLGEAFTVVTSMFMHGGWGHLGSNLLFLHIFGDNVEDALGHWRYLLFYLLSGVGAAAAQVLTDPSSPTPMVGASGAIAGVLGGYMVLFPRAPITLINPVPLLWLLFGFFIVLPAWVVAGLWFALNLMNGLESIGLGHAGGVAFFAHVGGFVAGLVLVRGFLGNRIVSHAAWSDWRPPSRSNPSRRNSSWGVPRPGPGRWDPWR